MIFVGKNKRILLKMLTTNSKNTSSMLAISSRNIWLAGGVFFRPMSAWSTGVVDMGPRGKRSSMLRKIHPGACGKGWEVTWQIRRWNSDVRHGQGIIGWVGSTKVIWDHHCESWVEKRKCAHDSYPIIMLPGTAQPSFWPSSRFLVFEAKTQ